MLKNLLPACLLVVAAALGCAAPISWKRERGDLQLLSRSPPQVEVLYAWPKGPYAVVGKLEAADDTVWIPADSATMTALRERAGAEGCEAIVMGGRATGMPEYRAACILFGAHPTAALTR